MPVNLIAMGKFIHTAVTSFQCTMYNNLLSYMYGDSKASTIQVRLNQVKGYEKSNTALLSHNFINLTSLGQIQNSHNL